VQFVLDKHCEVVPAVEAKVDPAEPEVVLVVDAVFGQAAQLERRLAHQLQVGSMGAVRSSNVQDQLDERASEARVRIGP